MSDDEEIICKGRELYTHLINQGYSDFETFDSPSKATNFRSHTDFANTNETNSEYHPNYLSKKPLMISSHDYEQLEILLKSKLLFKEDVDLIGTAIESCFINKTRPMSKWFWHISTLAGFIASLALNNKGIVFYLPCGFTFLSATYSLWNYFKETIEVQKCKRLICHIDLLQNLCSNVQKLLRFLKETEVLSGGKVKSQNGCSAVYIPVTSHSIRPTPVNELNVVPSWETQSHLRKCLLDSLSDVIDILAFACNVIKQIGLSAQDIAASYDSLHETRKFHVITDPDQCISLKELQTHNETYLALQSKYLKLISFNICPELLNSCLKMTDKTVTSTVEVSKFCHGLESKLSDVSFRLKMQYDFNNIYSPRNRSVGMRYFSVDSNELSSLQIEVHNIFLLMLSMLLRVRNVEDYLENIPSNCFIDNQSEIKASMSKQLNTLKDDLASTSKCFDHIYQVVNGIKSYETSSQVRPEKGNEHMFTDTSTTKRTGIIVGASDFNVNSPDEVFLAISGLYSEEQEANPDDWFFEKKPQIPMNLLSELSDRLKTRKKYFSEREKAALKRQGLIDFTDDTGERINCRGEAGENFETITQNIGRFSDVSESSDDEESCVIKMPYQRIRQSKRNVDSGSDNSVIDNERSVTLKDGSTGHMPEINRLSLAKLAAMKSQLWGNASEEYFS